MADFLKINDQMYRIPFEKAVMQAATKPPCVGHKGSRTVASRYVLDNLHKFGLPNHLAAVEDDKPAVAPVVAPIPKTNTLPKGNGTCAKIREWVVAHPDASREDAVAQFPDLNKSTVSVQFGQARRNGC